MNKHAKFSPSAAHRWMECPGSIRLSEGIESEPSEYAMEGTVLHQVLEQCLRHKISPDTFVDRVLSPYDDLDWSMTFDEGHASAVQKCINEVHELSKEYDIRNGMLEKTVDIADDCFGTVDVLLWGEYTVLVIDAKFGRGVSVQADGNAQAMLYAIGALRYIHSNYSMVPPKVVIVILQPRIENEPTRRLWELSTSELNTWYKKSVLPAMSEANNGDAVCNPGEAQCKFCPANAVCSARANYLLGITEENFKPYAIDEEESLPAIPAKEITLPSTELLTPEIAGNILKYQPDFDNFFKRVGEYALKSALDGVPIPGYKLVYGRSNRRWVNPENAEVVLVGHLGDKAFSKKIISPAQAEKKIKSVDLSDLIEKPLGKLILVDESDSRPAADLVVESDFEKYTNPPVVESTGKPVSTWSGVIAEELLDEDETATGNNPEESTDVFDDTSGIDDIMADFDVTEDEERHTEVLHGSGGSPPNKTTKKFQVLMLGLKGGASVKKTAEDIFNGNEKQVDRALRNLNERDGYTVTIHADGHFDIKE